MLSGGPHFQLTSDAMKKNLTGHASQVLLSIVHVLSCQSLLLAASFSLSTNNSKGSNEFDLQMIDIDDLIFLTKGLSGFD